MINNSELFFRYILLIGRPGIQQIKHWGFTANDTARNLFIKIG